MTYIPYKYNLHTLLLKLSAQDYEIAMKFLPEACGVHFNTFRKWIYRKLDDSTDIPSEAVVKMCLFFEIEIEDFYHEPSKLDDIKVKFRNFRKKHFPNSLEISNKFT